MSLDKKKTYPYSNVEMLPGDILYSSIGKSTYYVGHIVIIGPNYNIIESIPGNPSGHMLTAQQFWQRHNQGDQITLLRSKKGANEAAKWAQANFNYVKKYTVLNTDIKSLKNNYCSKWIIQAYYYGANVKLTLFLNRFIFPQSFERMKKIEKIALFSKT